MQGRMLGFEMIEMHTPKRTRKAKINKTFAKRIKDFGTTYMHTNVRFPKELKGQKSKITEKRIRDFKLLYKRHFDIWVLGYCGNARLVQLPGIIKLHHANTNCRDYYYITCLCRILDKNKEIVKKMLIDKENLDSIIKSRTHLKFYKANIQEVTGMSSSYYKYVI